MEALEDVEMTKKAIRVLEVADERREKELLKIAAKGDQFQDQYIDQVVQHEKIKEQQRSKQLQSYIQKKEQAIMERINREQEIA